MVFTLQSLMLVTLGVLIASLVVLAIAPAYRRRTIRLTTEQIRQSLPITEAEIRADKDKLRAQYAIRVHKLEAQGEQQRLAAARQLVEMNRRDARIAELEGEIEGIKSSLEENVNARRVLEHTVTDRLPRLEQQLNEASQLLTARDAEMVALRSETARSVRALDEALQINAQQRSEIGHLSTTLATRPPPGRDGLADPRFGGEIALRAEIESLRAKARDQAQHISRLEALVGQGGAGASQAGGESAQIDQLRSNLAEAGAALKAAQTGAEASALQTALEAQVAGLKARTEDQAAEIARLKAALATYEDDGAATGGVRDSRITAKARISSLQAQIATQTETIQKLRAELATSNERLARQASHFMDEMRRLGAGTLPTSAEPRRRGEAPSRRSLSERIVQPRPAASAEPAAAQPTPEPALAMATGTPERGPTSTKVAEYLMSVSNAARNAPAAEAGAAEQADEAVTAAAETTEPAAQAAEPKRRLRLLDRISGLNRG